MRLTVGVFGALYRVNDVRVRTARSIGVVVTRPFGPTRFSTGRLVTSPPRLVTSPPRPRVTGVRPATARPSAGEPRTVAGPLGVPNTAGRGTQGQIAVTPFVPDAVNDRSPGDPGEGPSRRTAQPATPTRAAPPSLTPSREGKNAPEGFASRAALGVGTSLVLLAMVGITALGLCVVALGAGYRGRRT